MVSVRVLLAFAMNSAVRSQEPEVGIPDLESVLPFNLCLLTFDLLSERIA
jgi:hypothetical protein